MRLFFCICWVWCFSSLGGGNEKVNSIVFSQFQQIRDASFLEKLFESDHSMLTDKGCYESGDGATIFKGCANDAKINCRKIVVVDGKAVAFVICFVSFNNKFKVLNNGDGVLPLMGVHPDHRRFGYGSKTMEHAINWFKLQKCSRVWLSVRDDNEGAQRLYKKHGFLCAAIRPWPHCFWWVLSLFWDKELFRMLQKNQYNDVKFSFQ